MRRSTLVSALIPLVHVIGTKISMKLSLLIMDPTDRTVEIATKKGAQFT